MVSFRLKNYLKTEIEKNSYSEEIIAREMGFKVLLTGDGSDELFAGYSTFSAFKIAEKMQMDKNNFFPKIINIIAKGIAKSAVGKTPRLIPKDCKYQVNRIVNIVPKDIMSPVAKFANRKIP